MSDESERLQALIRRQEAIMRTIADQLQREDGSVAEQVRAQANAESERLVSAMNGLSRARPAARDRGSLSPISRVSRGRRVLLVEDDDGARAAIVSWLAPQYEVVSARDGVEGLERARVMMPDAVITDVEMPGMDGITMVRRIRELPGRGAVPIFFLTAHGAPESVTSGFSAGGVGYLLKPVDLELLDQALQWALAGSVPSS
ncbi:MAG TPA: response regulator [Polyangiaceae bacterium]|nr:response regulator [Polyangiaceae bacterium]